MSTVYEMFTNTCSQSAKQAFLHIPAVACKHYADGAIDKTYGQALAEVKACADIYRQRGYGSPHRIALVLENRPAFFIHWLALNSLGCSVVPISADAQADEIAYYLEHSAAIAVIAVPETMHKLGRAPRVISCEQINALPPAPRPRDHITPSEKTECALLYTSGSTGKPKGCVLNNEYFTFNGNWYRHLGGLAKIRHGRERLLTPLPLTHMNAMACSSMAMIASGGCIVQLDRFHPASWWQTVRGSQASIIHYLGVLPAILLELEASPLDDFSRQIRFGFGAGVNPRHHAIFEARFGFPLLEAWAMTESGVGGCIIANHAPRHVGSCCFGKASAEIEYQLVDEQKQPVAKGATGELRVRGRGPDRRRGFFSGYLNNPEATDAAWQDGWLNSGDLVRESADGNLHFVDRRKNVIRRSGENIAALEVETSLALDSMIDEAIVTAVPDALRGDEVAACIVAAANVPRDAPSAATIVRSCLKKLNYFKVPGYIIFCDTLPKTASNKPKRADIKRLAKARLGREDCFDMRHLKQRRQAE